MNAVELIFELIMEATIFYVTYRFWQSYRQTHERSMLILTWTFAIIFTFHTVFALVLEDIVGYSLPEPFEPHHVLFLGLLLVIIYIQRKRHWRAGLRTMPKTELEEKAA